MRITFKNVGQGDSIILEWSVNGCNKIGLIDCKRNGKRNPVVEHFQIRKYNEIEFIFLSHPHSDHYSGLEDLLKFIETENIKVNQFGHTLKEIGKSYWEWFEIDDSETRQLADIIRLSNHLKSIGLIKKFVPLFEDWSIMLSKGTEIRNLSPSHDEIEKYQKTVKLDAKVNKKQASKAANLLSTIFRITNSGFNILLTADAEKETFERIHNEKKLNGLIFNLCQAPHHGSYNNYYRDFWSNLSTHKSKQAVFSAGLHESYNHPHYATVKSFAKEGYQINSTNIINGVEAYFKKLSKSSLVLDGISEIAEEYMNGGEKVFNF